jgi:hypothetical protein
MSPSESPSESASLSPSASESASESSSTSPSASESPSPSPTPSLAWSAGDIFESQCASLSGWTSLDTGTGATTQELFDGLETFKFLVPNNSSHAGVYQDVAVATGNRTYITCKFYPDTLGSSSNTDIFRIQYTGWDLTDTWSLDVQIQSDEIRILNSTGTFTIHAVAPTMDAWNKWTFEIVAGANPTLSMWIDGTLVINDFAIEANSGYPLGRLTFQYDSWFVANLLGYVDYIQIGTGAATEQDPLDPSASESPSESASLSPSASESASESASASPSNAPGPRSQTNITIYTFP